MYDIYVQPLLAGATIDIDATEFQKINMQSLRTHLYRELAKLEQATGMAQRILRISESDAGGFRLQLHVPNRSLPSPKIVAATMLEGSVISHSKYGFIKYVGANADGMQFLRILDNAPLLLQPSELE
jgi:hypothetical protein